MDIKGIIIEYIGYKVIGNPEQLFLCHLIDFLIKQFNQNYPSVIFLLLLTICRNPILMSSAGIRCGFRI